MNINIIDAEKEIRITRAEYEREYQEYLKACMFTVDPPSFEVWLARRWERRRFEGVRNDRQRNNRPSRLLRVRGLGGLA